MNLTDVFENVWDGLRLGASHHRSPFTMWQIATLGLDGSPQLRSIVLRGADEEARTLSFHTDRRSPKVAEVQADGRVSMVSLDLDSFAQLRINGIARVATDAQRMETLWTQARPHTLILYQTPHAPGAPIKRPEHGHVAQGSPASGFGNFALIDVEVRSIEYLNITPGDHRRALFAFDGEDWREQWIAP